MGPEATVNALRDIIPRRAAGLPLPPDVDLDELLEAAADDIEGLLDGEHGDDELHCDGCSCFDDEDDASTTPITAEPAEKTPCPS